MDIMDIQAVESKLSDVTVTPIPRSQVQNFYHYQQQREQREQQPQIQISAIHHTPRDRDRDRHSHSSSTHHNANNNIHDYEGHCLSILPSSSGASNGNRLNRTERTDRCDTLYASKRERDRDYRHTAYNATPSNSTNNAVYAAAALQYSQQLQAQLALLQQQVNQTNITPSVTVTPANNLRNKNSFNLGNNNSINNISNNKGINNNNSNNTNSNNSNHNNYNNSNNSSNYNNSTYNSSSNLAMAASPSPSQLKYPQSSSPVIITAPTSPQINTPTSSTANPSAAGGSNGISKYSQLLAIIEEMGRDIRPTYTGSRSSTERLKRGIVHARILVRECLMETERSGRQ